MWKICGIFLLASFAINVGAAVYWAKIVDDRIGFDPYTPKTCALPKSDPNDTTSEHFWMEVIHLEIYLYITRKYSSRMRTARLPAYVLHNEQI